MILGAPAKAVPKFYADFSGDSMKKLSGNYPLTAILILALYNWIDGLLPIEERVLLRQDLVYSSK